MQQIKQKTPSMDFMASHRHAETRVILTIDGSQTEGSFCRFRTLVRGDWYLRPSWYAHHNVVGPGGVTYLRLAVSEAAVRRHLANDGWNPCWGHVALTDRDINTLLEAPYSGDVLLQSAFSSDFFSETLPDTCPLNALALSLSDVQRHRISLEARGERLGMSSCQLSRAFKRKFGHAPLQFRRQVQIQAAISRMAESGDSLARIAADCGFTDQSHMTRKFRDTLGCTPRRLHQDWLRT